MSELKHLVLLLLFVMSATAYNVPVADFKVYSTKGFEVSIPAQENVTLFAFHGKLNEEMEGLEAGSWARDIVTPTNGRFVFTESETSLKLGDTIYYWTYTIYNRLGYREDDGVYVVTKYTPQEEDSTATISGTKTKQTPSTGPLVGFSTEIGSGITTTNDELPRMTHNLGYVVPHPEFKIFSKKGFEVSIPAEVNVTLFAFHGKLNEQMNGLETGKWARDIVTPKNGRFIFKERETSLKLGDTIYYWTYAVYNCLGYTAVNGAYVVTQYTPQEESSRKQLSNTAPLGTSNKNEVKRASCTPDYEVPHAEFKIFSPKGFEVSIPAEENVTLFAFHGKLNEEMDGLEAGRWARDIVAPKNGRFVFAESETSLKLGDTIYYWTYAIYNRLGYREDDGVYVVTKYTPQEEDSTATISGTKTKQTPRTGPSVGFSTEIGSGITTTNEELPRVTHSLGYEVPHPEFKIFSRKGFEVSIPADDNVTLFAFHGKLNEQMNGLETGKWARDIVTPKNGRFIFRERETSLKLGDTIYYWTYAVYNCLGYTAVNGVYVVTQYTPQEESSRKQLSNTAPLGTSNKNEVKRTSCTPDYEVPHAEFKIFSPKGFEVSIPAEENVTLFAFHGKLNEEMDGLETGKWARDIVTPTNGRFVFTERETSFKLGDTIYYWTYAVYKHLGYREDDGVYVITHYTLQEGV